MCECGCGTQTEEGQFAPGHDQRLRIRLEGSVGRLLSLRDLVGATEKYASGTIGAEEVTATIRRIYAGRQ